MVALAAALVAVAAALVAVAAKVSVAMTSYFCIDDVRDNTQFSFVFLFFSCAISFPMLA